MSSRINDHLDHLADQIAHLQPNLSVTTDPDRVRNLLAAGKTVCLLLWPTRTDYVNARPALTATFTPVLISPHHTQPVPALSQLENLLDELITPLGILESSPDSLQLGHGPYYPALTFTFEDVF